MMIFVCERFNLAQLRQIEFWKKNRRRYFARRADFRLWKRNKQNRKRTKRRKKRKKHVLLLNRENRYQAAKIRVVAIKVSACGMRILYFIFLKC